MRPGTQTMATGNVWMHSYRLLRFLKFPRRMQTLGRSACVLLAKERQVDPGPTPRSLSHRHTPTGTHRNSRVQTPEEDAAGNHVQQSRG